jgi:hypothetical protein
MTPEEEAIEKLFNEINKTINEKLLQAITFQQQQDYMGVHRILSLLQKIVFHYEGTVKQFNIDENGTSFVAVFGVAPQVHEDDPIRYV